MYRVAELRGYIINHSSEPHHRFPGHLFMDTYHSRIVKSRNQPNPMRLANLFIDKQRRGCGVRRRAGWERSPSCV